jgi:hypothetical protein
MLQHSDTALSRPMLTRHRLGTMLNVERSFIMVLKSTLAAAGLAVVALTGVAGAANAHGHGHGRHHFFFGHSYGPRLYIGPTYRDCSYYREMWEDTGRLYWKRKYYVCKGWW